MNQLLVPRSCRDILFYRAFYNPITGHAGVDRTVQKIMAFIDCLGMLLVYIMLHTVIALFYWLGWLVLSNIPQIPTGASASNCKFILSTFLLKKIGLDLIMPLDWSAQVYCQVEYEMQYPETVPLLTVSVKSVAEAVFCIISLCNPRKRT